jgi:hypothetical protein
LQVEDLRFERFEGRLLERDAILPDLQRGHPRALDGQHPFDEPIGINTRRQARETQSRTGQTADGRHRFAPVISNQWSVVSLSGSTDY